MANLVRVYDPDETERRINLVIKEEICPGFLEFLTGLPFRTETPLIRGIVYQWYVSHRDAGTLETAVNEALDGIGGLIEAGPPSRQAKKGNARTRTMKTHRPRKARPAQPQVQVPPAPSSQESVSGSQAPQEAAVGTSPPAPPVPPVGLEQGTSSPPAPAVAPIHGASDSSSSSVVAPAPAALVPTHIDPDVLASLDSLDKMF